MRHKNQVFDISEHDSYNVSADRNLHLHFFGGKQVWIIRMNIFLPEQA